jgi:hypothetical protein
MAKEYIARLTAAWSKILERASGDAAFRALAVASPAEAFAQVGLKLDPGVSVAVVEPGVEVSGLKADYLLMLPPAGTAAKSAGGKKAAPTTSSAIRYIKKSTQMSCLPGTGSIHPCDTKSTDW